MAEIIRRRELIAGVIDLSKKGSMAAIAAVTYNGSQHKPTPAITCNGKTLTAGTDFTYSWGTNTNAGTGTVTVTGTGKKYKGNITGSFTINKATGSVSLSTSSISISGSAGTTGTFTFSYTGDGSITVSSSNTGVCTASVSGRTVTCASLASGSATVTVSMAAGTNYTAASASCSVTCTRTITLSITAAGATSGTGNASYLKVGSTTYYAVGTYQIPINSSVSWWAKRSNNYSTSFGLKVNGTWAASQGNSTWENKYTFTATANISAALSNGTLVYSDETNTITM